MMPRPRTTAGRLRRDGHTPLGGQTVPSERALGRRLADVAVEGAEAVGVGQSDGSGRKASGFDAGPPPGLFGAMSERVFQAHVVAGLRQRGYVVVVIPDMRRTQAGWPDLAFWHRERPGRLWLWELKSASGRVRPEQRETLALLATVPGVDARVVRPLDWLTMRDEL